MAAAQAAMEQVEPATVVFQMTVADGRCPTALAAKVAAASAEHGSVDVLVIANPKAPTGAKEFHHGQR